jgi:integrase
MAHFLLLHPLEEQSRGCVPWWNDAHVIPSIFRNLRQQPVRLWVTVRKGVDLILVSREFRSLQCYETVSCILRRFDESAGQLTLAECRPFDLQCWLNEHPEYRSEWYRRCVISTIKRTFNWACEMELIHRNPFAKMRSRGCPQRRRPMTDDELQTLLRGSDPTFRRFLIFLKFSACRPGEAASMSWPDVHFEERAAVLKEHKTARKTGRPGVIPLVPTVIGLLHWMRSSPRASDCPGHQNHVFTNGRGNAFSRGWLSLKMQRLRRRLGLAAGVTLYGLRHRYGLMGIKNGVNLKLLSLCMGHVRTQMTEHYIAEAGLTDQVQQAAWQVAYGADSSANLLHSFAPRYAEKRLGGWPSR